MRLEQHRNSRSVNLNGKMLNMNISDVSFNVFVCFSRFLANQSDVIFQAYR